MGERRRGRELALQMLFQIDLAGESGAAAAEFWRERTVDEETRAFCERLVSGVRQHREELDRWIVGSAEHWRLERMATVDRNVLRLAVYELLHEPETPRPVIIDEAVEVAKKFGGDESGSFVNGILDSIRRRVEAAAGGGGRGRPQERRRDREESCSA